MKDACNLEKETRLKNREYKKGIATIGIIIAVIILAVVGLSAYVGINLRENNNGNEMLQNEILQNEILQNENSNLNEMQEGNNVDTNESINGTSNYVIAGSEEERKAKEELQKLEEERTQKEGQQKVENNKDVNAKSTAVSNINLKYAGAGMVLLASNEPGISSFKDAINTIATDISTGTLTLSQGTYTYNGQRNTPDPTLKVNGQTLILGRDYTIKYTNNINVGNATATATGINGYSGTKTASYKINAASVQVTWQKQEHYKYNGTIQQPTVTSPVNGVNGEKVYLSVKIQDNKVPQNAGNYTAKAVIDRVEAGTLNAVPGDITVSHTHTTDEAGNTVVGKTVKKGEATYIQITASQTNGTIKSVYGPNGNITAKNGKYTFKITENGTYGFAIVGSENTSKWYPIEISNYGGGLPEGVKVGDYVDYQGIGDKDVKWRVWELDEKAGEVKVIPTSSVGSVHLEGSAGWLNSEKIIDDECKKYTSPSIGVTAENIRSLRIEDIEPHIINLETLKDNYVYGKIYQPTNQSGGMLAEYVGEKAVEEIDENGNKAGTIDGYNKEIILTSNQNKKVANTYYGGATSWETVSSNAGSTNYGALLGGSNGWLASRCVYAYSNYAYFSVRYVNSGYVNGNYLWYSYGNPDSDSNGVRPLVSLNSTLFTGEGAGTLDSPWKLVYELPSGVS